jgi:hypothetical protein
MQGGLTGMKMTQSSDSERDWVADGVRFPSIVTQLKLGSEARVAIK